MGNDFFMKGINQGYPDLIEVKKRLQYEPSTGLFRRVKANGDVEDWKAGSLTNKGYFRLSVLNVNLFAHRLAYAIHHGSFPDGHIDHINGITTDNRISNLRCVSHAENMKNRVVRVEKKRKFKGYYLDSTTKKWRAVARIDGKIHWIGSYVSENEAHEAYINFIASKAK